MVKLRLKIGVDSEGEAMIFTNTLMSKVILI